MYNHNTKSLVAKIKKTKYVCRVSERTLGKLVLCRVPCRGHSAKITAVSCRWLTAALLRAFICREPGSRHSRSLPSVRFCRVFCSRQRLVCRVFFFAEGYTRQNKSLPSARILLSAKCLALGKDRVSGSGVTLSADLCACCSKS
jgi:hypothetical protein